MFEFVIAVAICLLTCVFVFFILSLTFLVKRSQVAPGDNR